MNVIILDQNHTERVKCLINSISINICLIKDGNIKELIFNYILDQYIELLEGMITSDFLYLIT